jgi:hypothetical protein
MKSLTLTGNSVLNDTVADVVEEAVGFAMLREVVVDRPEDVGTNGAEYDGVDGRIEVERGLC